MDPFDEISSTPFGRPARQSLAGIRKNTVSGMVNRFNQIIESTNSDVAERQVPFAIDVSSINHAPVIAIDSKLNSVDSGYESFRRRAQSVSSINLSKNFIAKCERYPNFRLDYLKYFGVDSREYLEQFGIDFDSVANSSNGVGNRSNIMRTRSQTSTFKRKRPFDSTVAEGSSSKYFRVETAVDPMKVTKDAGVIDFEDEPSSKVAANRNGSLDKTLRSIGTQTPEISLDSFGSDVVSSDGKISPERESKKPSKDSHQIAVDSDLKSRIRNSIKSYDTILKATYTK